MGKIHKAAREGKVAEVQHILLLGKGGINDRDENNRTALHLACYFGHPQVVTLLVQKKCNIDARDIKNCTALIMAVQCQEEECVTILLEHGADPNIVDTRGLTALHHAVLRNNIPIISKLLSHNADIEAKNKDDLTPMSFALKHNRQQVATFLAAKKENIHAIDEQASNFEREERSHEHSEHSNRAESDLEETSDEEEKYHDGSESNELLNAPKVIYLWKSAEQHRKNHGKHTIRKLKNRNSFDDTYSGSQNEDVIETLHKTSVKQSFSHPYSRKHKEKVKKEMKKRQRNVMKVSENLCDGASPEDDGGGGLSQQKKSWKAVFHKFPIKGNEKHNEVFERAKFKDGLTFRSGPALLMKKIKKNKTKECTSRETMILPMFGNSDSLPVGLLQVKDGHGLSETLQDEGRFTEKTSNKKNKVKKQIYASRDSEQLYPDYPDYDNILLLIEQLKRECKDTVSLSKIWSALYSYKRSIELQNYRNKITTEQIDKMENEISDLQKKLSEKKEMQSQLEEEKGKQERELCSLRFALKQEEYKRRNANFGYEKIKEELREKEKQYNKEIEMKQQLEISIRTLEMELNTMRSNFNQVFQEQTDTQRQLSEEKKARILKEEILVNHFVKEKELEITQKKLSSEVSMSHKKANDLLHENHMLRDEMDKLRLELDTIKDQHQEREKKYLESMETLKERNDDFQKAMKLKEEMLTQTIVQCNEQLSKLKAENAMLNSKLQNEKQNNTRLEMDLESHRSRLAAAACGCDRNEQRKVNKHVGKKKSLEERSSQLQSENMFLQLQLYDGHNKIGSNEKTAVNMQDQFHNVAEKLQPNNKTQIVTLEERNKEIIDKSDNLQERLMYQYKNEQAEKRLHEHMNQHTKDLWFTKKLKDYLQKYNLKRLKLDVSTLKATVTKQEGKIEQLQQNQLKANVEFLHMKTSEEIFEKLEEKNKLEQEVINLRRQIEKNTEGHRQTEQSKQETEERSRKEVSEKLEQSKLSLETPAAQQERLYELRESPNAAQRRTMELRYKDLESEVFEIRTQLNSYKIELEKFKRLYLEERELRKSLLSKYNKTNKMLEKANRKLLELQQNCTGKSKPVGKGHQDRKLHDNMGPSRNVKPSENLVVPTSHPQSSFKHCVIEFQKILQTVDTEVNEAAAELETWIP